MIKPFAKLVVVLAALSLGVGQACACAGWSGVSAGQELSGGLASHTAHGERAEHASHAAHAVQGPDAAAPCGGDCDHCAPDTALAQAPVKDNAKLVLAFAPDIVAVAEEVAAMRPSRAPPEQAARRWLDPPRPSPVTLNVRLLT